MIDVCSVYRALKNSLIIHKDKTKEIYVSWVSLCVQETRLPFSINFLLNFMAHTRSIFKMFTSMNLRNGSFLKPFKKLAVLSSIKHIPDIFYTWYILYLICCISIKTKIISREQCEIWKNGKRLVFIILKVL